jgi:hypothetical protein
LKYRNSDRELTQTEAGFISSYRNRAHDPGYRSPPAIPVVPSRQWDAEVSRGKYAALPQEALRSFGLVEGIEPGYAARTREDVLHADGTLRSDKPLSEIRAVPLPVFQNSSVLSVRCNSSGVRAPER